MGKSGKAKTRKVPDRSIEARFTKQNQKRNSKFFAWLGEVVASNMRDEDFDEALVLFDKGVSIEAMLTQMRKRYK